LKQYDGITDVIVNFKKTRVKFIKDRINIEEIKLISPIADMMRMMYLLQKICISDYPSVAKSRKMGSILSPKKRPVCHRRKIENGERNGKRVSGFEIRFFD
jgi:hypothetical protein